jgi:hypothetical protein
MERNGEDPNSSGHGQINLRLFAGFGLDRILTALRSIMILPSDALFLHRQLSVEILLEL